MRKAKKKYIPKKRYNPAVQALRIDKIKNDLDTHQKHIKAITTSHDNHITHLANFARHDIKNTIQNIDSILSTTKASEFTDEKIDSLSSSLEIIRNTIDNFAKLVPYSTTGRFKLIDLMVAVELLARADMQRNKIKNVSEFPRDSCIEIDLPFHAILQMMNNIIINSVKSLETVERRELLIAAQLQDSMLHIKIKDSGNPIKEEDVEKIFEYGYSTTGGSGIGLFHARFLCDNIKGSIEVDLTPEENFNKTFLIQLPLTLHTNGKDDSHN